MFVSHWERLERQEFLVGFTWFPQYPALAWSVVVLSKCSTDVSDTCFSPEPSGIVERQKGFDLYRGLVHNQQKLFQFPLGTSHLGLHTSASRSLGWGGGGVGVLNSLYVEPRPQYGTSSWVSGLQTTLETAHQPSLRHTPQSRSRSLVGAALPAVRYPQPRLHTQGVF